MSATATATAKPIHGAPKPKDVPADMRDTPPMPFAFKVGDVVSYKNSFGAELRARIRGFANPPHGGREEVVSLLGPGGEVTGREVTRTTLRFVYLEFWNAAEAQWIPSDAWWFAVEPSAISDHQEAAS